MIRLEDQRQQLESAVAAYDADPRSIVKHRIRSIIPYGVPFWVPEPLRRRLLGGGLSPQQWLPGHAWGVVAYGEGAFLVCLAVSLERNESGQELPLPVCLSQETAGCLYNAAHEANRLYPHFWPIEPRSQLRFRLLDLAGNELNVPAPVMGRSLGLAAFVATYSLLAHRPVAPGLVFTGLLGGRQPDDEVPVERVECITAKHQESCAAKARLVLPGSQRRRAQHGGDCPGRGNCLPGPRSCAGPGMELPGALPSPSRPGRHDGPRVVGHAVPAKHQ